MSTPVVGTGEALTGVPVNGRVPLNGSGDGLTGLAVNGRVPLNGSGDGLTGFKVTVTGVKVSGLIVSAPGVSVLIVPIVLMPGVATLPFARRDARGDVPFTDVPSMFVRPVSLSALSRVESSVALRLSIELDVVLVGLRAVSKFVKLFAVTEPEVPVAFSELTRFARVVAEMVVVLVPVVDGVLPPNDSVKWKPAGICDMFRPPVVTTGELTRLEKPVRPLGRLIVEAAFPVVGDRRTVPTVFDGIMVPVMLDGLSDPVTFEVVMIGSCAIAAAFRLAMIANFCCLLRRALWWAMAAW